MVGVMGFPGTSFIHMITERFVMNVMWERGSATVAEVLEDLQAGLAYTTVLTILRRLENQGRVRPKADGKAHRYLPLVQREEIQDQRLEEGGEE